MRRLHLLGRCMLLVVLAGSTALALAGSAGAQSGAGGISYASRPDEAALYLNDMVFVRDTVTLPGDDVRVLLPPGTYPDTLILTEDGARVRSYRITPQGGDVYYSQAAFRYDETAISFGGTAYAVTWESASSSADMRTIMLEYMMSGAQWTPSYDMAIGETDVAQTESSEADTPEADTTVDLAFFAAIRNSALMLDDARVYLVAGRVDLSQQVNQAARMTMNQVAVGYADQTVELPALGVGSVDLQHIYMLDSVTAMPGDQVYESLVDATLPARRLLVWNAASENEVDVIYKVRNTSDTPLAQGIVRAYRDGMFLGSDYVETTPRNSEGSITVGSLPDVRVFRTESESYEGGTTDTVLHTVELTIDNFSADELDLTVLDPWLDKAWDFEYSLEAERQQDNLLRWEVTIPAGESLTITYSFRTEY